DVFGLVLFGAGSGGVLGLGRPVLNIVAILAVAIGLASVVAATASHLPPRLGPVEPGNDCASRHRELRIIPGPRLGCTCALGQSSRGRSALPTTSSCGRGVGVYELADGRVVTVTLKAAKAFVQVTGMPGESKLAPETTQRFFFPGG